MSLSDIIGRAVSALRGTERFEGESGIDSLAFVTEPIALARQEDQLYTGFDTAKMKAMAEPDLSAIPANIKVKLKPVFAAPTSEGALSMKLKVQLGYMEDYFNQYGLNSRFQLNSYLSCQELCTLPKTKGKLAAVPDPRLWPFMATTGLYVLGPLVKEFGANVVLRGGYRPEDYNKAVKGAPNSRHVYFQAVDLDCASFKGLMEMIRFCAAIFNSPEGRKCKMGFGVYGTVERPTSFHIDTCFDHRHWGRAQAFL